MNRRCNPEAGAFPLPMPSEIRAAVEGAGADIGGLTKREYFAVLALQGILTVPAAAAEFFSNVGQRTTIAVAAVRAADELITELDK